ncbi:uncharacterized protein E6C27_scaffold49288G00030 [Cucumis melo var. makuwa]|uniref:Uncharacterized protein n=1 Tax=Cucumis melo var. makuwa TaxID=1194695 RepID=A0A5A7U3U3_CUCMM|nr:uncharacterized protein E6C27_scaffold49288G00030 [Cucumis melo var. makuwa]
MRVPPGRNILRRARKEEAGYVIRSTRRESQFRTAAPSSDLSTKGRDSFHFCGLRTQSPLTTNQKTSSGWVLPVSTTRKKKKQMETATNYGSWPRQGPRLRGDRSKREGLDEFFLGSSGERSQFAAENKTGSEPTFVRFFSTKHGSFRITVGRWLPKETPIRSAPRLGGIYLIPITRRGSP